MIHQKLKKSFLKQCPRMILEKDELIQHLNWKTSVYQLSIAFVQFAWGVPRLPSIYKFCPT